MIVFDLKSKNKKYPCSENPYKEWFYEQWSNCFLPIDGFYFDVRIQSLCKKIQWQLQDSNFHSMESLSLYGIFSTHWTRKLERPGCLPERDETQALSHGVQMQNCSKHHCLQQRKPRLENFCGFRPNFDSKSQQALCKRRIWCRIVGDSLCSRFFHDRSLSFSFSMGKISKGERCSQITYIVKFEREYTLIYQNYRRESPRCKYPRRITCGTGVLLCYGSWIFRFCQAFQDESGAIIFCNPVKEKLFISPSLFAFSRQINWLAMRSNYSFDGNSNQQKISRISKAYQISRLRKEQNLGILNQQFFSRCIKYYQALQMPLADRAFFQMGKTTFKNQSVLWDQRKCRKITNMDSNFSICASRNCKKGVEFRDKPLHNSTNFKCCFFRESSSAGTTYKRAA